MHKRSFSSYLRSKISGSIAFLAIFVSLFSSAQAQQYYELIKYTGNSNGNSHEIEAIDLKTVFSKDNLSVNTIALTLPDPIARRYSLSPSSIDIRYENGKEQIVISGDLFEIASQSAGDGLGQEAVPVYSGSGQVSFVQSGQSLSGVISISSFSGEVTVSNRKLRISAASLGDFCGTAHLNALEVPDSVPIPMGAGSHNHAPMMIDNNNPQITVKGEGSTVGNGSNNGIVLSGAAESVETELDLLIAYTPDVLAGAGSQEMVEVYAYSLVEQVNNFLRNSRVDVRFRLVGVTGLSQLGTGNAINDLSSLTTYGDGIWDEIHGIRNSLGADFVTLMEDAYLKSGTGGNASLLCGIGWIVGPGTPSWASDISFNVISSLFADDSLGSCGARVLAHEIGHNLGLDHDLKHAVGGAAYPDSHGHKFSAGGSLFATIMSYLDADEVNGRYINYFSNSEILFDGVPSGVVGEAEEAASLNRVAQFASNHRSSKFVNLKGKVTDGVTGISAVNILVDGVKYGITGPDGSFSLVYPKTQSVRISPQSTGREFSPSEITVQALGDASNIDFLLTKDLGSPLSGFVRISLAALFGSKEISDVIYEVNGTRVTDKDLLGTQFIDIARGADVSIQGVHPYFDLIPARFFIPAIDRNESRVFQAEEGKQWITGRIKRFIQNGNSTQETGLSGVNIRGNGGLKGENGPDLSVTSADGFYRFREAKAGSRYYVIPASTGIFHFFPPVGNISPNLPITVFNFTALDGPGAVLSGVIRDQYGQVVPAVPLILTCSHDLGTYVIEHLSSDQSGRFAFAGLPIGSRCSLDFNKRGYTSDGSGEIVINSDTELNPIIKRGFYIARGSVNTDGGLPLQDVLISTEIGAFYTDPEGRISVDVTNGQSITLVPMKSGYYFDPPYCDVSSPDGSDQSCSFKAIPTDKDGSPYVIVGPPQIAPGGNGTLQIKINFVITTGVKPTLIRWQISQLINKKGKKWSNWKLIKNANGPTLTLKTKGYKPGKYRVRALIQNEDGEVLRSKSGEFRIKNKPNRKKKKVF